MWGTQCNAVVVSIFVLRMEIYYDSKYTSKSHDLFDNNYYMEKVNSATFANGNDHHLSQCYFIICKKLKVELLGRDASVCSSRIFKSYRSKE